MDAWDAIRSRRDIRSFSDRGISDTDLDRILEAGRRSPSAMNRQPWTFIVCRDPKTLDHLAAASGNARQVVESAVTVALVVPKRDTEEGRRWLHYDLGQVTMSMMIAAAGMGIGSSHAAVRDEAAASAVLGIPDDHFCPYLVAFGYPAGTDLKPIVAPDRKPLEEIVRYEHW
jgi:nitroreductase